MSQDQVWLGPVAIQLGLGVAGMTAWRRSRTVVRGHASRSARYRPSSSSVTTTSAGDRSTKRGLAAVEDVRAFGRTQGPGGRRTVAPMPGTGL